jgi:exopolyphosphatase/pppGpp-phosphohydrolase
MRSASVHELKQELLQMPAAELTELCLRLAKYKKENKELLTYLMFEAHDEQGFIQSVKKEVDEQFEEINQSNLYYVKKTLRKILRNVNKHIKYSGSSQVTVELLIYFCKSIQEMGISIEKNAIIANLYKGQLEKINKTVLSLHEDLQHDYSREVASLAL